MKNFKLLNTTLWIVQIIVAVVFIWLGFTKLSRPETLPFPWIKDNPILVLITGMVDILGGLGLVLPSLLRIQPQLTVYAAYGSILLMVAASIFHISRGEPEAIGFNMVVSLILAFIAWGRQRKIPILPKGM